MNNSISASRLSCLLECPRKHYWTYEVGLEKTEKALPLRFGSAWARAMEARWEGKSYNDALAVAMPDGVDLDAHACATVAALLAGYYNYYGKKEAAGKIHPEVEFRFELFDNFTCHGYMDGLGSLKDGRSVLVESKTTSAAIDNDSEYWMRLRFNGQVLLYAHAARQLGWDITEALYDVTRKPFLKPKYLKGVIETSEVWGDRLYQDIIHRPDFYFARREVPIIDGDLEAYEKQVIALVKLIQHYRLQGADEHAWPRNCGDACKWCQFQEFCLQNISVNLNHPPAGLTYRWSDKKAPSYANTKTNIPAIPARKPAIKKQSPIRKPARKART